MLIPKCQISRNSRPQLLIKVVRICSLWTMRLYNEHGHHSSLKQTLVSARSYGNYRKTTLTYTPHYMPSSKLISSFIMPIMIKLDISRVEQRNKEINDLAETWSKHVFMQLHRRHQGLRRCDLCNQSHHQISTAELSWKDLAMCARYNHSSKDLKHTQRDTYSMKLRTQLQSCLQHPWSLKSPRPCATASVFEPFINTTRQAAGGRPVYQTN